MTPVTDNDLLAYVDGHLPAPQRATVEAFLAAHPDRAAEVQTWRHQNDALHALFDPAANEPVPARLDPHTMSRQVRRGPGWTQLAAAAMLLLALGSAAGWAGRTWTQRIETRSDSLFASAILAHALYVMENGHAVEVAAADREHLVSWLSNRVERPITPPDISGEGFTLVGGRLLPGYEQDTAGPAAQLMYEDAAAERVTVYITAALPEDGSAYEFATRDQLDAFYWSNDRITCTVVGDLPADEMKVVAKKIYQQLTWRPDPNGAKT
jgi:anti-sigma factor RsiW